MPTVYTRRTRDEITELMEKIAIFAEKYPAIATASTLATIIDWNAASIATNAAQLGINLTPSVKGQRVSLASTVLEMVLSDEYSDEQIMEFRRDMLALREETAVSE